MSEQTELVPQRQELAMPPTAIPSPITILEAAVKGGITAENVAVMKELVAMCREQRAEESKAAFARAFFQLRKNMPPIYADREAKDKNQNVVYTYCSEEEISKALEPHLMAHGFAMLFGQSSADGRITVNVTLMHEAGHSELREFTVRSGTPNAMKDGAMCDAGGATTAWRHLMIKMFGLKSRIQSEDARIVGEKIDRDRVTFLKEQIQDLGGPPCEAMVLKLGGVTCVEDIGNAQYDVIMRALEMRRAKKG